MAEMRGPERPPQPQAAGAPEKKSRKVLVFIVTAVLVPAGLWGMYQLFGPVLQQWGKGIAGAAHSESTADPAEPFSIAAISVGRSGEQAFALAGEPTEADHAHILAVEPPDDAVPAITRVDSLVVRGLWDERVNITAIRVVDVSREESPSGTWIDFSGAGTGGDEPRRYPFTIDLGRGSVSDSSGADFFQDEVLSLTKGDSVILDLTTVPPGDGLYRWLLRFDFVSERGGGVSVFVDGNGQVHSDRASIDRDDFFVVASEHPPYSVSYARDEVSLAMRRIP
ncbi:hypothetical protein AB1K54_01505 [Microbacterium sp. BWT-B31]|uniref:hypothetical protein n=1 Tax=Microbacterium sp. BWT-B31 TaxID=3232072 RepID=UPI003529880B